MGSKNKFGKRHYTEVARIMLAHKPISHSTALHMLWEGIVDNMVEYFQSDNPRFSQRRFKDACFGIGAVKVTMKVEGETAKEAAE